MYTLGWLRHTPSPIFFALYGSVRQTHLSEFQPYLLALLLHFFSDYLHCFAIFYYPRLLVFYNRFTRCHPCDLCKNSKTVWWDIWLVFQRNNYAVLFNFVINIHPHYWRKTKSHPLREESSKLMSPQEEGSALLWLSHAKQDPDQGISKEIFAHTVCHFCMLMLCIIPTGNINVPTVLLFSSISSKPLFHLYFISS